MSVRTGTDGTRYVETRSTWQFTLSNLVDGLCSRYWRDWCEGEAFPPDRLSARAIVRIAREEHEHFGTTATWAWTEGCFDEAKARAWARRVILESLPGYSNETESQ